MVADACAESICVGVPCEQGIIGERSPNDRMGNDICLCTGTHGTTPFSYKSAFCILLLLPSLIPRPSRWQNGDSQMAVWV